MGGRNGAGTAIYAINTDDGPSQMTIQVALADGSVRAISENIDMDTLRRLAAADDGVPLGEY